SRSDAISLFGGSEQPAAPATAPPPTVTLPGFAALAEHISPSAVTPPRTQEVKSRTPFGPGGGGPGGGGPGGGMGEDDPFQEFYGPFERFFGQPPRPLNAKHLRAALVV